MNRLFTYIVIFLLSITPAFALEDVFADTYINKESVTEPYVHNVYDYSSFKKVPIRLNISNCINDNSVFEGQQIEFKLSDTVYSSGKLIARRGTIIPAKIETVITSGMNGIPASIIIGEFCVPNTSQGQITNYYEVKGQDRSLWVYPLKWALTILPPTGSLTNFIKGGHAKLKPSKTIEIYYYPERI